jgi:putative hydrolase of the HAD superfamily
MVLRRYLEREGLLRHFQVVTFSDEVRLRKPEAEIFRRTLAKLGPELGLEPHEVAHIGDNPEADVEGARAVGMRAVHYAVGGRAGAARADLVVTDLASLAERLAAG